MKILFIVDNYMGGAGNIIQLLATEYAKENEVTVLLTHKTIEKRYECPGVKFVELSAKDKPTGFRAFPFQIKWIKKRVKEEKPDVIISFLTINNIMLCLGHLRKRVPIIACERNDPFMDVWKFPWNLFVRWSYDRADVLTVQFEHFKKMYNSRYEGKCRVTPNYIAKPTMHKSCDEELEKTRLISCGRLNEAKQFELLLEMFAEIHRREPATELKIYGHGPLEERLKNKIVELGLENDAFLAGYTTDTYSVLCNADVYLMPSKREGFPNALSEAMAVGLPSVSFACHQGIDELADHGRRGTVVAPNDREAFIEAVLELCHDRQKCREQSRDAKEVSEIYSMANVKKIWDACIEEAIEKRGARSR